MSLDWSKIDWALIIGITGTVIGILSTFYTYKSFKRRDKKRLSVSVSEPVKLVNVSQGVENDVEIRFKGKIIKDAQLVTYNFSNSGVGSIKNPIKFDVYERPIHLVFGDKTDILQKSISNKNPEDLNIDAKVDGQKVIVTPVLMNEGNSFTLSVIASNIDSVTPDWHIEEVEKDIQSVKELKDKEIAKIKQQTRIVEVVLNIIMIFTIISLALASQGWFL